MPWRQQIRAGSLADFLDRVFRKKNLLSFYAALPNGAQRRANLEEAFQVRPAQQELLEGKRILLVDDLMTTGATLNELASELKRAGVSWVGAIVVARTLKGPLK